MSPLSRPPPSHHGQQGEGLPVWGKRSTNVTSRSVQSLSSLSVPPGVPPPGLQSSGEPGGEHPGSGGAQDPHRGGKQPPLPTQGSVLPHQVAPPTYTHRVAPPTYTQRITPPTYNQKTPPTHIQLHPPGVKSRTGQLFYKDEPGSCPSCPPASLQRPPAWLAPPTCPHPATT